MAKAISVSMKLGELGLENIVSCHVEKILCKAVQDCLQEMC